MTNPSTTRLLASAVVAALTSTAQATAEAVAEERFAGSFLLDGGGVVTGGPFVERYGDQERFLFLDVEGLERGGLFERDGDRTLRSVIPPDGTVTIELVPADDPAADRILWRSANAPAVAARRVRPHVERTVEIPSGDGVRLTGRLLVPSCPGPHPLVATVSGSGPATRFGGTYDTFFAGLGMAVLSWDKRGVGGEDWSEPDLDTLAADAVAALRFAAGLAEIDGARSGLWGSSQGGWVAPIAAVGGESDFLIVRAGPGVSVAETVLHEIRQELRLAGLDGLDLDHATALREQILKLAAAGAPLAATDSLVGPYLDESWYRTGFGEGAISTRWSERRWDWNRRNLATAPGPWLRRYAGPVLWFLAEDDENVPLVPSRAALEAAFAESAGDDHELVVIAGADHAFLIRSDGPPRFAPGYWTRVADWLRARGFTDESCWSRSAGSRDPAGSS